MQWIVIFYEQHHAGNEQISKREEVRNMVLSDDMLMLKNGQMLVLRDNEIIVLSEDMILADGTCIAADGRVIMTDGTYQRLVEGQSILVENRTSIST